MYDIEKLLPNITVGINIDKETLRAEIPYFSHHKYFGQIEIARFKRVYYGETINSKTAKARSITQLAFKHYSYQKSNLPF